MIVIVVDDQLRYKVMHVAENGEQKDVTEHWQLRPLVVEDGGKQIHGFHIGAEQQ